jgi:hypothetical protein
MHLAKNKHIKRGVREQEDDSSFASSFYRIVVFSTLQYYEAQASSSLSVENIGCHAIITELCSIIGVMCLFERNHRKKGKNKILIQNVSFMTLVFS